jgi:hypothetical protein
MLLQFCFGLFGSTVILKTTWWTFRRPFIKSLKATRMTAYKNVAHDI